jgi:hypothetical protein
MKTRVPIADVNAHLRGYQAAIEREYSNNNRHVYFSRPMQKWIIVRRRGNQAELEFTDECPCTYEH